jgi:hypothetical protein
LGGWFGVGAVEEGAFGKSCCSVSKRNKHYLQKALIIIISISEMHSFHFINAPCPPRLLLPLNPPCPAHPLTFPHNSTPKFTFTHLPSNNLLDQNSCLDTFFFPLTINAFLAKPSGNNHPYR